MTMEINPSISVVIPAYNAAKFLPEVIRSVLEQTYQDWELIVINDGSTDETTAVVEKYCQLDARIRLVNQENSGVSAARNLGVDLAKAELVAFLDSDDIWFKDKLSVHVNYMNIDQDIGVSFARVELMDFDGRTTGKFTNNITDNIQPQTFFYTNPTVTTSNIVLRKSIFKEIDGFDKKIHYSEDIDLLFRIALKKKWKIVGIDQVLVKYRSHDSGLSSKLEKMEDGWIDLMEKARKTAPHLVKEHYCAAHAAHLQYWARQTLRLKMSPSLGIHLINRALFKSWKSLYKQPKTVALVIILYIRFLLFSVLRFSI
ncbi:MAG: glycosyltransferase [Cyanobacteria bacterium P01_D01_bin.156]